MTRSMELLLRRLETPSCMMSFVFSFKFVLILFQLIMCANIVTSEYSALNNK